MKIWIVSDGEPLPTDNENVRLRRMGNLAHILSQRGNEVIWFSSNFEHYNKQFRSEKDEVKHLSDNYKIVLLGTKGYKRNISLGRLLHFKLFSNKFAAISKHLSKPDVILSTMAPIQASKAVEEYAHAHHIPFVIDIRDLWPKIYYEVTPKLSHPAIKVMVEKNINTLREIFNHSAGIVGVTSKFLDYGLNIAGFSKRKNDAVFHTAYPDIISSEVKGDDFWEQQGIKPNDFVVTFVGNFGKQFDLKTVFEAIDLMRDTDIKFVLCGVGEKLDHYLELYRDNAQVIMPGWVGKNEIVSLLKRSSIGIAPYIDSINFRLNMPNKFGEYLSASLPVLVGVQGMMQEMLEAHQNGAYYQDAYQLRDEIMKLYQNRERLEHMAATSRKLYNDQFKVDTVYTNFAKYLERIANQEV